MKIDLSGKTTVVTGGSGQLGRTMVRTLSGCGANVAIHYLKNSQQAEALRVELVAKGVRAMTVQADVTNLDSVLAMQKRITGELGDPAIIINNAVAQDRWVSMMEFTEEEYNRQYRSCVLHNVFMAKAFVPAMIKNRYGRVVAISTECAMQCTPGQAAYASAKRGMDGVLRTLAREIGEHQITVNQVAPGWTISDRDRQAGSESQPAYEKNVPMKRRGTDQDIANAVAFLASDLAGFITGAYIPVCGGNVMPAI